MSHHLLILINICLYFFSNLIFVEANIHLRVSHDTRRVIYLGSFAFGPQGIARLKTYDFIAPNEMLENVNNISVLRVNTPVGFLLEPIESPELARAYARYGRGEINSPKLKNSASTTTSTSNNNNNNLIMKGGGIERMCFIKDPLIGSSQQLGRVIFPFQGLSTSEIINSPITQSINLITLYGVYFYNCADMPSGGSNLVQVKTLPKRPISFNIDLELYWANEDNKIIYLSYGDRLLPVMYALFGIIFTIMGVIWISLIVIHWIQVKRIHLLMLLLVFLKMSTLFLESIKLHIFSKTGRPSIWDYFFYITVTLKGIMLFGVILLLGAGWSLLREYLSSTDKRILLVVLPCQILLNICLAIIEETSEGNRSWTTWYDILQILDVICCCCVLFPVIWSIKKLRETADTDESTARTVTRMREFRTFYVVIVTYIYFTRIVLIMVANASSFDKSWIAKAGAEIVAVIFYFYCGCRFRPKLNNLSYDVLHRVDIVTESEMKEFEVNSKKFPGITR